ncbi:MAG: hydroxymethylbilane synthase [Planctomycetota bacterium]|nr:hydroxymethylbilane synthase [Planctomycetota bacterium]
MRLRIGTRASALALVQSRWVQKELEARGHRIELVPIETHGDADQVSPFASICPPGVFVSEIERALAEGRVDLAVHSYKDLPGDSPRGLTIAAVPPRADAADRLLIRPEAHAADGAGLPLIDGARVGSSAARRRVLLSEERPDLRIAPLRGNVPTRVRRLQEGDLDAIVLAAAGLDRLDAAGERGECETLRRDDLVERRLDPKRFVPAPSQGALALQVQSGNAAHAAVADLDDAPTRRVVEVERELLRLVQAGCDAPFGAHCSEERTGRLVLRAVLDLDDRLRRAQVAGDGPEGLAARVHEALLACEERSA